MFEGFTDYLAHIIMLRAGVTRERDFYRMIAEDWPKYATRPGRNETPLDELSFEAWIKQYKPSENFINRAVSYYEKGLVGRHGAGYRAAAGDGGRRGLPEMFRRLWERFGRRGRPVDRGGRARRGRGGRGPAHRSLLRPLHPRHRRAARCRRCGGAPGLDGDGARRVGRSGAEPPAERDRVRARRARAWTGIDAASGADCWSATSSPIRPPGAPGITFGDDIVAVDGARVNPATFARRVGDHEPGARVAIAYFRRDLLREATLTLAESPARTWTVTADCEARRAARAAVRAGWLGRRA